MPLSVLLVGDNALMRQGLCSLLRAHPEFALHACPPDGEEAQRRTSTCPPDIVLIDLAPRSEGRSRAVAHYRRRWPSASFIALTHTKTHDTAHETCAERADAYVLRHAGFSELLAALRRVSSRRSACAGGAPTLPGPTTALARANPPRGNPERLTARERVILQLLAEGRTNRGAAEFLSLSPKTVEKHRANLMRKFGLSHAIDLTLAAAELGLIELASPGGRRPATAFPDARRHTENPGGSH